MDAQLQDDLRALKAAHLARSLTGPLPKGVVNFSSNDYLGLASHPTVVDATSRAAIGARAARLIGADFSIHRELESALARFKNTESALLFSTGYHANLGAISALVGRDDAIYSDMLNHASLIDGARLSRAKVFVYKHLDIANLERKLAAGNAFRRRLIITDSVFGMDGDVAPLSELSNLARKHDAWLLVDEAHATGVHGPHGAGVVADSAAAVDIQVMTFGKALGTFGAAVLGSKTLTDYLTSRARTFIFTTAPSPSISAATLAALNVLTSAEGDDLRLQLQTNVKQMTDGLTQLGFQLHQKRSPVIPLIVGEPKPTLAASQALLTRGFFVQAIRPPTVPQGTSRLRLALSATHTADHIDDLLGALAEILPPRNPNQQ